jgi:hypothetical protein
MDKSVMMKPGDKIDTLSSIIQRSENFRDIHSTGKDLTQHGSLTSHLKQLCPCQQSLATKTLRKGNQASLEKVILNHSSTVFPRIKT